MTMTTTTPITSTRILELGERIDALEAERVALDTALAEAEAALVPVTTREAVARREYDIAGGALLGLLNERNGNGANRTNENGDIVFSVRARDGERDRELADLEREARSAWTRADEELSRRMVAKTDVEVRRSYLRGARRGNEMWLALALEQRDAERARHATDITRPSVAGWAADLRQRVAAVLS